MVIHSVFIKMKNRADTGIVSREIANLCRSSDLIVTSRFTEVERTTADSTATLLVLMEFLSLADVDAFLEGEAHQRVAAAVRPLIADLRSWDSTRFDPWTQQ